MGCPPFSFLLASSLLGLAERPHILYINTDDLGYADVGCYGGTYYETPNIDSLAADGVRFTDGYATATNCAPSRVCAMTGQWSPRHGVYTVGSSERGKSKDRKLIPTENGWYAPDDALLLPQVLKDAGYRTAHFGKWHVNKDPLQSGFEKNFGEFHGGSHTHGGYHAPFNYPGLKSKSDDEYLTDRLAEEGVKFIKEHAQGDAPFFLNFTTYTVHSPIQPREDLLKHYKGKKGNKHHNKPQYAATVHALDEAVGRLLKALDEE